MLFAPNKIVTEKVMIILSSSCWTLNQVAGIPGAITVALHYTLQVTVTALLKIPTWFYFIAYEKSLGICTCVIDRNVALVGAKSLQK